MLMFSLANKLCIEWIEKTSSSLLPLSADGQKETGTSPVPGRAQSF